jgi:hypothetical protein
MSLERVLPTEIGRIPKNNSRWGQDPGMAVVSLAGPNGFGSLVDLAVQRILVGDEVAATRFHPGASVDDLLRERQVLAAAGRRAVQRELVIRRRLQEARIPVAAAHHLDALHRRALDLATEWACSAE